MIIHNIIDNLYSEDEYHDYTNNYLIERIEYDNNFNTQDTILSYPFNYDLNPEQTYIKVSTPEELNNISILSYDDYLNETNEPLYICPITTEEFKDETKIGKLRCGHYFEYNSIYEWLSKNSYKCPCCRFEFDNIEILRRNITTETTINNDIEEELTNDFNVFINGPYSTLMNRSDIIPHSYI
jgi:hypothetical protein